MGFVRHPHCTDADWVTVGPIAPHADAIKQHFANGGYAPITVASYLTSGCGFQAGQTGWG
jgi:hypothetical protein